MSESTRENKSDSKIAQLRDAVRPTAHKYLAHLKRNWARSIHCKTFVIVVPLVIIGLICSISTVSSSNAHMSSRFHYLTEAEVVRLYEVQRELYGDQAASLTEHRKHALQQEKDRLISKEVNEGAAPPSYSAASTSTSAASTVASSSFDDLVTRFSGADDVRVFRLPSCVMIVLQKSSAYTRDQKSRVFAEFTLWLETVRTPAALIRSDSSMAIVGIVVTPRPIGTLAPGSMEQLLAQTRVGEFISWSWSPHDFNKFLRGAYSASELLERMAR